MNDNERHGRRGVLPAAYLVSAAAVSVLAAYLIFLQARGVHRATSEPHATHYRLLASVSDLLVLDARLTMAAGEPAGQRDFERLAAELDAAVKQVGRLAEDGRCAGYASAVNEANLHLADLERRSLGLSAAGRKEAAAALLTGGDYLRWKKAYADGVKGLLNEVEAERAAEGAAARRRIIRFGAAAILASSAALLLWALFLAAFFRRLTAKVTPQAVIARKEEEFRHFFDTVQEVFYRGDWRGRLVDITPSILKYSGFTREELLGLPITSLYQNPGDRAALIKRLMANGMVEDYEVRLKTKDRGVLDVLVNARLLKGFGGLPVGVEGSLRDITARKTAERQLERLNRLYNIMRRASEAMLRARDERGLFEEICRIAVEDGGVRFAWVGRVENDLNIRPVARYGEGGDYLERGSFSTDPAVLEGRGPTGVAAREKRVVVNPDTSVNPAVELWRERMLRNGFRSSAAFPITGGVVAMYASEAGFFAPAEERLLASLSEDISYALAGLRGGNSRPAGGGPG